LLQLLKKKAYQFLKAVPYLRLIFTRSGNIKRRRIRHIATPLPAYLHRQFGFHVHTDTISKVATTTNPPPSRSSRNWHPVARRTSQPAAPSCVRRPTPT